MNPLATTYVQYAMPPPYATGDPVRATQAVNTACTAALAITQQLSTATLAPTWANLVVPLDAALERMDREYSLISHLSAVVASPAWNEANNKSLAVLAVTQSKIGQNTALYKRLQQLATTEASQVPQGRSRILGITIADFELAGVGLPDKQRKEFTNYEQLLSQLGSRFEEHVRTATASWVEKITDVTAFGNMPTDMIAAAQNQGAWQVSLLDPSFLAYMTHGTDRGLRERLAKARNARASDLGATEHNNLPLVREIIDLRWRQAKLLDFPSPAAMILTQRMAADPSSVDDFLTDLATKARPHALREQQQLEEFARTDLHLPKLEQWDMAFVAELYQQQQTGLSENEVRPYFGVEKVLAGLFACATKLFGVCFSKVTRPVWDAQTQCFAVTHSDGSPIGHLYLDLFARTIKRGGAWAHGALTRSLGPTGQQLPVALINCNFSAASDGSQPRLGWQEVVTLFHETGHALHHLLAKIDDYCASGMNGVEWDAVELPSQFLENFAWQPEIAIGMSMHITTGAPLPDEMFAKLTKQRNFLSGLHVTRQLSLARFDLALHSQENADPLELWDDCASANLVTPLLPDNRTPCSFGHIFAGGYASGYYGYLWADVLAADAYEIFSEPGADQAKLGRQFAQAVLERGGSRDATVNFRDFRGRDPRPAALLRRLGLS